MPYRHGPRISFEAVVINRSQKCVPQILPEAYLEYDEFMIIDGDGHFFETEEMFDKYMESSLRNYRPRLLTDEQGHNFWVVDGQTSYKRPTIKGAGAPGTAAPPGKALQSARRATPGSQTLTNLKERLEDLDREAIDLQFIYPSFLLHANAWPDGILANGVCRAYNTWLNEACSQAPDRLKAVGVVSLMDPLARRKRSPACTTWASWR